MEYSQVERKAHVSLLPHDPATGQVGDREERDRFRLLTMIQLLFVFEWGVYYRQKSGASSAIRLRCDRGD